MLADVFQKVKRFFADLILDNDPHFEMRRYVEGLARKYRGRVIWDHDDNPDNPSSK
jgi:hypothetical protein